MPQGEEWREVRPGSRRKIVTSSIRRHGVRPGRRPAPSRGRPDGNVPRGVHHDAVLDDVGIGAAILFDVVRVVLDHTDGAVAAVGSIAVGMRQGVGRVQREPLAEAALELELERIEPAFAAILGDVHERAVERVRQARVGVGILVDVAQRDVAGCTVL